MDVTDIEAGVDFVEVLERAVGSCDELLAVIGREWLTCTDRHGRRRLDDPHDFIRLEIGTALARNKRVIPVLVEGARMPLGSELPPDLDGLTRRQAVELRDSRWADDVENLAEVLDRTFAPTPARTDGGRSRLLGPEHRDLGAERSAGKRAWLRAALFFLLAAAVAGALWFYPQLPTIGETDVSPGPPSATVTPGGSSGPTAPSLPPVITDKSPSSGAKPGVKPEVVRPPVPVSPVPTPLPNQATGGVRPTGRSISVGSLGARIANAADRSGAPTRGAMVQAVSPGGAAETSGLRPGDLIVEYGGAPVSDAANLGSRAAASTSGDPVLVGVIRGDTGRTLEFVVGELPTTPGATGTSGTVLIHYAADADRESAENLAAYLRKVINDRGYAVRTLKTTRKIGSDGEILYSSANYSTLAATLARNSGSWWARQGSGRRIAFGSRVEPRVTSKTVILNLPERSTAPANVPAPVVTIAYPSGDDPAMADRLAAFLSTQTRQQYAVRVTRATAGPQKEGQIEYDNAHMGDLAQALARDAGSWISREYGRRVVLRPTSSGRIGSSAVLLWLPGR